jgi:hypothetical protein
VAKRHESSRANVASRISRFLIIIYVFEKIPLGITLHVPVELSWIEIVSEFNESMTRFVRTQIEPSLNFPIKCAPDIAAILNRAHTKEVSLLFVRGVNIYAFIL